MVSVERQGFTPIPLNSPKDAPEYHDEPHRGDTTHPLEGARMEVMSPERLEISTPLDTPRDVFPDEELARPRSRQIKDSKMSTLIPFSPPPPLESTFDKISIK